MPPNVSLRRLSWPSLFGWGRPSSSGPRRATTDNSAPSRSSLDAGAPSDPLGASAQSSSTSSASSVVALPSEPLPFLRKDKRASSLITPSAPAVTAAAAAAATPSPPDSAPDSPAMSSTGFVSPPQSPGGRLSLKTVLENDALASEFQLFLASEFAAENLFFYRVISKYERPSAKIDEPMRLALARTIYDDYLRPGAQNQVNIRADIVAAIRTSLERAEAPLNLFDEAKKDVFRVMEADSFARFLKLHVNGGSREQRRSSSNGAVLVNPTLTSFVDPVIFN